MVELKRTDLALRAERAVLVQVAPYTARSEADATFEELESLARNAGARIVGRLRQQRDRPDRRYYVGKGKVQDLRSLCRATDADVVICDDELSADQVRMLEAFLDVKVVDRSEVILDIFAAHARTRQARLQVELAQLEYEFPRLKRMWTHLDRTAGGTLGGPAGGGIGVRGPGEKQLEVDRRLVQKRIHDLKKNLKKIEQRRRTMARGRNRQFLTVALVGYTNAGKSSLMNALTGADVSVRDRLFETLDTRTRRWDLPGGIRVLLSDTVGFIRKFPHHLAASFHATLEEVIEADLLLHVIDAARKQSEQEIEAVGRVLAEIQCADKPTIYVLNKIDRVGAAGEIPLLRRLVGEVTCTSALTGEGLDELCERVARFARGRRESFRVRAHVDNGRLIAFLHDNGHVVEERAAGEMMDLKVEISLEYVGVLRRLGAEVLAGPAAPSE